MIKNNKLYFSGLTLWSFGIPAIFPGLFSYGNPFLLGCVSGLVYLILYRFVLPAKWR